MAKRPFVGILFQCCRVYGRAYLRPDRTAYEARCPRCYQNVRLGVSAQGSQSRFYSSR